MVYEKPDGTSSRLRKLRPGAVVGEVGFYLKWPRFASVVVDQTSVVYRLSRKSLEWMERNDPELAFSFHRLIIELLALRVTHSVQTLSVLMKQ